MSRQVVASKRVTSNAKPVLYMGDDALTGAACYLGGVMTHWGIGFEHVPSGVALAKHTAAKRMNRCSLFILSDYPRQRMSLRLQMEMVQAVQEGAGLLMLGGWESFHGKGGDWDGTPVGDALPVVISKKDDRVNCDQAAVMVKVSEHAVVRGLPFEKRTPTVGGFNRVQAKPDAGVLVEAHQCEVHTAKGKPSFTVKRRDPLLVVGSFGLGRTAVMATDLAPHWVGGFVDWGTQRINAQAKGGNAIEVGDMYAKFIKQLVQWVGQL